MNKILDKANSSKAWPFIEAKSILEKIKKTPLKKDYILFETGYGPSGLPHIGTFGEVARTTMVMHALKQMSNIPTRLFAFSDDMDGLRKVPDNIPNKDMVRSHLGKPLTTIPDPFGTHESFGHHMNARLCSFLDQFGFRYEFKSATEFYKSGKFDDALMVALKNYDAIMKVMLPTLGEERQATYSPFLPICPETGVVLQVPILSYDVDAGTITYKNEKGTEITSSIKGGNCKLQWKADWAMRWYALEVDYEMHGKDLIPSAELSSKICKIMGKEPPTLLRYELFLDEKGQKISKSKGNGLSMDEWLRYAPAESLSLFMYQAPQKAKKLYFDVIPKNVDEYLTYINKYTEEDFENPVWHIHSGNVPKHETFGLNFSLLLNLASACNPEDKSVLWGFITKYAKDASPEKAPFLDKLVDYAIRYYNDFVKPTKQYKTPSSDEKSLLNNLKAVLSDVKEDEEADAIQTKVYELGKNSGLELKDYFQVMYELLLGQTQGPRLGSFFKLYGLQNSIKLIDEASSRN